MDYYSTIITALYMLSFFVIVHYLSKLIRHFYNSNLSTNQKYLLNRRAEENIFLNKHNWIQSNDLKPGFYCNFCETSLFQAFKCTFCGLIVDDCCAFKADAKIPCKKSLSDDNAHFWVPGNLPQNSECIVCDEECGHGAGLVDFQCSWCKVTSHEKCKQRYTAICDYGKMKEFIIPPSSIKLKHRDILSEFEKWKHPFQRSSSLEQISEITAPNWANERWTPLLVFVNTKSGNGEGALIMDLFRQYLNPIQVHDLANYGPESVLKLCKLVSKNDVNFKIIIAGGDGTIGWVQTELENLYGTETSEKLENQTPPPPAAIFVLPLGTGNDLSRLLGCGSAFDCSRMDIHQILSKIQQSELVNIDRWIINVEQRRLGVRLPAKTYRMTNYVSIGVDALVTFNFHRTRQTIPRVVSGRLMNKLLFFTFGTKDVLERACRDLSRNVELFLDGRPAESRLPDLEGVTILNIPYWGAGVQVWRLGRSMDGREQKTDDGMVEVLGLYSSFHMAQLQVALSQPFKIGQAREVKLVIKKGPLPMQVDGEPWLQYGPATVTIRRFGRAAFLATSNSELLRKNPDENDAAAASGDLDFNLADNSSDFFYFE